MKSIDMIIMLLSFLLLVILLFLFFIVFGGRLGFRIKKSVPAIQAKSSKGDVTNISSLVDYNLYRMTFKENLICILTAGVAIFAVGYVFYRSIVASLILTPLALLFPKFKTKEIITKRKAELNLQFREALYAIASSLSAGKSVETALKDAESELSIQYTDTETYILKELKQINKRIEMNETIEEALADFAARSHLEDILNFTDVFVICKRTGGNLVQVVKSAAEIISEKIDMKQEIAILLTEKKLEHKVLNLMPVLIVLLLSVSAEEFMSPVFTEPLGRIAMTFSLILFVAAFLISKKIMDIEV